MAYLARTYLGVNDAINREEIEDVRETLERYYGPGGGDPLGAWRQMQAEAGKGVATSRQ